jgi:hypothetical protein
MVDSIPGIYRPNKTVDGRRARARTVEILIDAIREALDTVTKADIGGWFRPGGYPRWQRMTTRGWTE